MDVVTSFLRGDVPHLLRLAANSLERAPFGEASLAAASPAAAVLVFAALPFRVGRLKTGTPPRIDGRSIDYSGLQVQPGDEPVPVFSYLGLRDDHPRQVACHITATNERTHALIRAGWQGPQRITKALRYAAWATCWNRRATSGGSSRTMTAAQSSCT